MRNKLEPSLRRLSKTDLRKIAEGFRSFKLTNQFGEFQEAIVVTSKGNAGFVYFLNVGGEWKINEM